jgi:F5/8 type C domain
VCVPETTAEFCKRVGKDCGSVDGTDNCGGAVVGANCGSCQGFKLCGGGGQDNVCGALTDPAMGGIATASSVMSIGENGSKAFDLSANTKWFAGDGNATGWLAYQFVGTTSHVVHSYSVTSANDMPQRDPSAWQLQGSNDGGNWTIVDQRTAQVFATRHQTNSYTCAGSTAYRWYRLLITANGGTTSLQLAELVLYAN